MENTDTTVLAGPGDAAVGAESLGALVPISNYKRAHRTAHAYFGDLAQAGRVEGGERTAGNRKCDTIRILGVVDATLNASRWWQRAFSRRGRVGTALPGGYTGARREANLEILFHRLAKQWRAETAILSSARAMAMHPAYQRIIGLGPRVLSLILRELQREPDHWFWALHAITGENPVSPEDSGDIGKMAEAWIHLGRERGWI